MRCAGYPVQHAEQARGGGARLHGLARHRPAFEEIRAAIHDRAAGSQDAEPEQDAELARVGFAEHPLGHRLGALRGRGRRRGIQYLGGDGGGAGSSPACTASI